MGIIVPLHVGVCVTPHWHSALGRKRLLTKRCNTGDLADSTSTRPSTSARISPLLDLGLPIPNLATTWLHVEVFGLLYHAGQTVAYYDTHGKKWGGAPCILYVRHHTDRHGPDPRWKSETTGERLGAASIFACQSGTDQIAELPSPRFIKSHMQLSLLPPELLDTAKMVYVARDPRDVAVSFYRLNRLMRTQGYVGDFKTFWNFFIQNLHHWTPFFDHLKEAWEKRDHPNMFFLFYEELSKDLPASVRRVEKFFGKKFSDEQIEKLCDHLSIDSFKNNKSVNYDVMKELGILITGEQSFIRKGK